MALFSKLFGRKAGEPGLGVDELARRLGMEESALRSVPVGYREWRVPKKSGGERRLQAPLDPLKVVQRRLLRRLLSRLSAHPCAMGFERGRSISTNAAVHVGAKVIVKMDLKDFFPRTTEARVRAYFAKIGWGGEASDLLVKLTTHKGGLPQGAPTSPRLSNLVNYALDARLFALGLAVGCKYTRYADDMTFSYSPELPDAPQDSPRVLEHASRGTRKFDERAVVGLVIQNTKVIVAEYGYKLHQDKKLQIRRRHDRMLVTGLVVNQTLNLPRTLRKRLRSVEHHLKTGKPATMTAHQLQGWRAYAGMVAAQRAATRLSEPPSNPAA